jgi:hypothetical protein
LRLQGVWGLRAFPSDENGNLLHRLLEDQAFWQGSTYVPVSFPLNLLVSDLKKRYRYFPIRQEAYQILIDWGIAVPQPIQAEPDTSQVDHPLVYTLGIAGLVALMSFLVVRQYFSLRAKRGRARGKLFPQPQAVPPSAGG